MVRFIGLGEGKTHRVGWFFFLRKAEQGGSGDANRTPQPRFIDGLSRSPRLREIAMLTTTMKPS